MYYVFLFVCFSAVLFMCETWCLLDDSAEQKAHDLNLALAPIAGNVHMLLGAFHVLCCTLLMMVKPSEALLSTLEELLTLDFIAGPTYPWTPMPPCLELS